MEITDIARQAKNPNRYNIFVDGEFAFGIDASDLLRHKLAIGMKLDPALKDKLLNEVEFARARDAAVKHLGRGPKSAKEVADRLAAKEFSPPTIARVMDLLAKHGYLDDAAFAAGFIRHKSGIKNYGKRRIVMELLQKGVAKDIILAGFAQIFEETDGADEVAAAVRALEKKLRGKDTRAIFADHKEKARLTAFLARRGFSYDVIKKALGQTQGQN